jgi:transcription elongation factor Elf1
MPKHYCPMCGSRSLQVTNNKGNAVCMSCEASVVSLNSVTVIQPRPTPTA